MPRQVKVSGYVRTRRKGNSTIVTTVRPYQRGRPVTKSAPPGSDDAASEREASIVNGPEPATHAPGHLFSTTGEALDYCAGVDIERIERVGSPTIYRIALEQAALERFLDELERLSSPADFGPLIFNLFLRLCKLSPHH